MVQSSWDVRFVWSDGDLCPTCEGTGKVPVTEHEYCSGCENTVWHIYDPYGGETEHCACGALWERNEEDELDCPRKDDPAHPPKGSKNCDKCFWPGTPGRLNQVQVYRLTRGGRVYEHPDATVVWRLARDGEGFNEEETFEVGRVIGALQYKLKQAEQKQR